MRSRLCVLPVAALTLAVALAGCSGSKPAALPTPTPAATPTTPATTAPSPTPTTKYADQPTLADATAPCGSRITSSPSVARRMPKGFPVLPTWAGVMSVSQGKTFAERGVVKASRAQITALRDQVFAQIKHAGYVVKGSDQEPGFEADGDFVGPQDGNINVKLFCRGYLLVTYTFNS